MLYMLVNFVINAYGFCSESTHNILQCLPRQLSQYLCMNFVGKAYARCCKVFYELCVSSKFLMKFMCIFKMLQLHDHSVEIIHFFQIFFDYCCNSVCNILIVLFNDFYINANKWGFVAIVCYFC
jgi:hypothetical protein